MRTKTDLNINNELSANVPLTSERLNYILETHKRAIEINIETIKQNEEIIEKLEKVEDTIKDIDKNMFRLIVFLGSSGVGIIIGLIKLFFFGNH